MAKLPVIYVGPATIIAIERGSAPVPIELKNRVGYTSFEHVGHCRECKRATFYPCNSNPDSGAGYAECSRWLDERGEQAEIHPDGSGFCHEFEPITTGSK